VAGSEFTLYLFGGSVPWGFPYAPRCDIGRIVSQTWAGSVDGATLVLRNEARYGAPSRYVLERARSYAQRTRLPTSKAVALIFSGNNEFIHLLPGRGSRGRGPALVSAEERYAIIELHRRNLEASILELARAGIEVVLSTIPTNLRDWPPSYTVFASDRAGYIEQLYSTARDASGSGRADEARDLLLEILRVDAKCAQAHFLLGRVHLTAGNAVDARRHLVAANDCDGRPIRATSVINENIRALAATHGIRLLDAEASFHASAPDGVCGNVQFWDDCHPKLEGYVQLAELLGAHIADLVRIGNPPPTPPTDEIRRVHALDQAFLADLYGRAGLYCYKHSDCWESEITLDLAEDYLRRGLSIAPENVEVHIALALLLAHRGDDAEARHIARTAYEVDAQRALWLLHGREARATLGALGITNLEHWALGADG
jgi:tetratricopeptide (TPR) repeat protein